jgi:hypothetical protein
VCQDKANEPTDVLSTPGLRRGDWRMKKTMQFLRSAAGPLASLLENTSEFLSWLTPFFRFSRSQNRAESFRATDIPRRRYPASMVWGRFVMASVDSTGGTLIGKTCPVRLSSGAIAELGYQGRDPCLV